jgi:hypothetical protein
LYSKIFGKLEEFGDVEINSKSMKKTRRVDHLFVVPPRNCEIKT